MSRSWLVPTFAVSLAVSSLGCAQSLTRKKPKVLLPEPPGKVLVDVDLTKGNADGGQMTGGAFDGGWRVTANEGQRIVFDAGHPVANGYLEVSFTLAKPPHGATKRKIDWVGLYEDPSLSQEAHGGDVFYARAGQDAEKFARIKAYGKKFDKGEWENAIGNVSDWVTDDKTVQKVRLEWRNGQAIFHDTKGAVHMCPKKICGGEIPIDHLRYAFIGSDKYTGSSLEGIRFLSAKMVEYQMPAAPSR